MTNCLAAIHNWLQHFRRPAVKVALCCIVKMENEYIRFFVEYYRKLHFDKLFIYDNNDADGERPEQVINDYIRESFVEVIDFRGRPVAQLAAYQDCYDRYSKEYAWMAFLDCDEFLDFADGTHDVHDFLRRSEFKPFHVLHINWMIFGDNDVLDNDGRNVVERFSQPVMPADFLSQGIGRPWNDHIKSIVRGGLDDITWTSPHTPVSNTHRCCNAKGEAVELGSPFAPFDHSIAYIRHYRTKSVGEWVRNKMSRGIPDRSEQEWKEALKLETFFEYNRETDEKWRYARKIMEKNGLK